MINEPMLIADDTLVLINLRKGNNRIPARAEDGRPIRHVGEQAADKTHLELVVEEGIETMGRHEALLFELPTTLRCFYQTRMQPHTAIRLWRRFSLGEWNRVCGNSIPCSDGRMLYTGSFQDLGLEAPQLERQHLKWLPEDADLLIHSQPGLEYLRHKADLLRPQPVLGIRRGGQTKYIPAEHMAELARSGRSPLFHPQAEKAADAVLRATYDLSDNKRYNHPSAYPGIVIVSDAPIVNTATNEVLVCMRFVVEYFSFIRMIPVFYQDTQYYIACLNDLYSQEALSYLCPYHRREMGVFSEKGFVSDRAVTEGVYEKYLLMSLL